MSNFHPVREEEGGGGGGGGGLGGSVRIGGVNVPYWAIAAGLVAVGLLGYLVYQRFKGTGGTQAQQATGTVQAGLTPMAAAGSQTGSYDILPTPYPSSGTTVGTTPAQASGLGLTGGTPVTVQGESGSPGGVGTGPITTPTLGGYPVTNQIYWVSGSGSDLGSSVSNNNPSAQSLTNPVAT